MTKQQATVSIIVWSAVALVLIIILVLGSVFLGSGLNMIKGELREIYSVKEDNIEFDTIDIGWHAGNVNISPSDDNSFVLRQKSHYDVKPLKYEASGKKIVIRQKTSWTFFLFWNTRSSDLELLLPQKQYEEIILKATSGGSDINGVNASSIRLSQTSGKLDVSDLVAKDLFVSMTSGNTELHGVVADNFIVKQTSGKAKYDGEFGAIECSSTSGEVEITTARTPENLVAKITSGDISVTIPDNEGFTIDVDKTSGSFDSSFDLVSNIKSSDGFYSYGKGRNANRDYTVKITSGKFELLKLR